MVQGANLFALDGKRALALRGVAQAYAWGKVGAASRIASVLATYERSQPLAEYWLGSHPKAPATVVGVGGGCLSLTDALRDHGPALLGAAVASRYHNQLPFLLKILSINPDFGLSIQAHPDSKRAGELHLRDPVAYPDPRHKPEVALALTRMTLLYGFRPLRELYAVCLRFPELLHLLDSDLRAVIESGQGAYTSSESELVRGLYRSFLTSSPTAIAQVVAALKQRWSSHLSKMDELAVIERLSRQYGEGDVGLVALLLMNIVTVEAGKAVFIAPNVPHAYLDGDLVECMACSDNVVRAGLTPKYRDVETLLEMLDYTPASVPLIEPRLGRGGFFEVETPTEEFQLSLLPEGGERARLMSGPAVKVVLALGREVRLIHAGSGDVLQLSDGGAALIPPDSGEYLLERDHAALFMVSPPEATVTP